MKKRLLWCFLLIGCLAFTACSDEDDPFAGKDNFITSFSLSKDNQMIKAEISDNEITMNAPLGYSLNGATANVVFSENATIKPNPAEITDWDNDYVFVVTSYNGQTKEYTYSVVKDGSELEGSVILTTQAEVDAFGASGVTAISGSLIIGAKSGQDSIKSIAPLDNVKSVAYGVTIKPTYAGKTLDGLAKLATIGGTLRIDISGLQEATLPALTSVMTIDIASRKIEKLEFPKLTRISDKLKLATTSLTKLNIPLLETIAGDVSFGVPELNEASSLQEIAFPALKNIGGSLSVDGLANIKTISAPQLATSGTISLKNSAKLTTFSISMPKLEECKGQLIFESLAKMQVVELPSLVRTGSLQITSCDQMENIILPKLKEVKGDLKPGDLLNLAPNGFKDLAALTTVGGVFQISYSYDVALKSLPLPPALKSCHTLDFVDCATLQNIDVTGMDIKELSLQKATLVNLTIKGDRTFSGTINIYASESSKNATGAYTYIFPKFDGIKEIGGLYIVPGLMPKMTIAGITKINGNLKIENSGQAYTLAVQDLTEVTGNITSRAQGASIFEFASIKKVGGDIMMGVNDIYQTFSSETISFPSLTEAGGVHVYAPNSGVKSILMPQLTTITNSLTIMAPNHDRWPDYNTTLTNLDGFGSLKSVKTVNIERMVSLVSYEGLKNCLGSLTKDEQWVVFDNKYNPSLADMKAGAWNE